MSGLCREVLRPLLCLSFSGKKDGKWGKHCCVMLHNLTLENKRSWLCLSLCAVRSLGVWCLGSMV